MYQNIVRGYTLAKGNLFPYSLYGMLAECGADLLANPWNLLQEGGIHERRMNYFVFIFIHKSARIYLPEETFI